MILAALNSLNLSALGVIKSIYPQLKFTSTTVNKINERVISNAGGLSELLLTAEGKRQREISVKLQRFIDTYPLAEDRLANELVQYSVAFGHGRTWLGKFGGRYASILLLLEHLEGVEDTMKKFMDMDAYLKEFQE